MEFFPEEILEIIFNLTKSNNDRNSISMVCKTWFEIERKNRCKVFVMNSYAINPKMVINRFPRIREITLKGRPHFKMVNNDRGSFVISWLYALAKDCPFLEELRLKRMVVSDECLEFVSKSFVFFKSLVLVDCLGFTTDGLASIAANCRYLQVLDLKRVEVHDPRGHWLSCFPESCTSLVSLNFACLKGQVNFESLERLIARNHNLRSLRLNRAVPITTLLKILSKAPQLADLGVGSFVLHPNAAAVLLLKKILSKCGSIISLSGFFKVSFHCLPAILPVCGNLTTLNLSYAPEINSSDLTKLILRCKRLQRLWILDCIEDKGLAVVASTCKDLEELRVFSSNPRGNAAVGVTEEGLISISSGCPKLHSICYVCHQMTNVGLITVAKNCPNLTRFRVCILYQRKSDPDTEQPLDEGFGAIVQSCKSLKRLSISGLLTNKVFLYIGMYAEQLEVLSMTFAGDSDEAMMYVLNGCKKLRKLEIMGCPFGNAALLNLIDSERFGTLRSLWMSSCQVTFGACKLLAKKMPQLNVEIINKKVRGEADFDDDRKKVENMYLYPTLVGPRQGAPGYLWRL